MEGRGTDIEALSHRHDFSWTDAAATGRPSKTKTVSVSFSITIPLTM